MNGNRFSGERLESKSTLAKNNLLEHLARYELVRGAYSSSILDIGCGSGHGSFVLSKRFKKVYGVDIAEEAIRYAKTHWNAKNIVYSVGSGTHIPFADDTFDCTVAFEVFEHIADWQTFLKEVRRVTKRNGTIYISTPNKNLYSPGTKHPINPHHKFEMTPEEFTTALSKYVRIETLYGQRTPVYNDHWIWRIVDPLLQLCAPIVPYKLNNSIKLAIINVIKPVLDRSDIVFLQGIENVRRSRFMVAVCTNR